MNLYTYVQNNPLNWIDPSGNIRQGSNVLINLENARKSGYDGYVFKLVKEQLGSEAKEIIDGAYDNDNNDFKWWFSLATKTNENPDYNTDGNAYWASNVLATIFQQDYDEQMNDFNDMVNFIAMSIDIPIKFKGSAIPAQLIAGVKYERQVLSELGIIKNTKFIGNSIPDAITNGRILEIKGGKQYVYRSKQFRDYLGSGMPVDLIVAPDVIVSRPLAEAIRDSQGTIKVRMPDGTLKDY